MVFSCIVKGISGRLSNLIRNLKVLEITVVGHYAALESADQLLKKERKEEKKERRGKREKDWHKVIHSFVHSLISLNTYKVFRHCASNQRHKVTISATEKLKVSWEWQPRNERIFPSQTQRKPLHLSCSYCSRDRAHDGVNIEKTQAGTLQRLGFKMFSPSLLAYLGYVF